MTFKLVYGTVLGSLFLPFAVVCIVLLFLKRKNNYIRVRNTVFLIIQACGCAMGVAVFAFYVGIRDDFDCTALTLFTALIFPFLTYSFVLRCWEYCANFYIATSRTRESISIVEAKETDSLTRKSWFIRHRRLGNAKYLVKLYLCTFWIWIVPILPSIILNHQDPDFVYYDSELYGCTTFKNSEWFMSAAAGVAIISMCILAVMLRNSKDAFHIRTEIIALAIIWTICIPILLAYTAMRDINSKYFPYASLMMIALFGTFCLNTVLPLYLVYQDERGRKENETTDKFASFKNQLALPSYRNAFFQFLSLQFCAENILFYEAATEWKAKVEGKLITQDEKEHQAIAIYDNFIVESGEYQINITSDIKDKISLHVDNKVYSDELYDQAIKEVLEMMYANSYHLFVKSKFSQSTTHGSILLRESASDVV